MKIIGAVIVVFILLFARKQEDKQIAQMNPTSFNSMVANVDTLTLNLRDTIPNKTIKIYSDKNGYPIKYSRNIVTGVCIDGECRKVAINLFWNSTGRYLGFQLPHGEFLSKTEHTPFNEEEYKRLHEILSDAYSPLASYTLGELAPKTDTLGLKVDAVSSATIEAVLDHIVDGAVYTTYTLWHIVYGETKHEIEKLSAQKLNSKLCLLILNSPILKDQVWILNHISAEMELSEDLLNKLTELISGNDIYLAERALNALKPKAITNDIQQKLGTIFQTSRFLQKRLILQKLKECNNLTTKVVQIFASELNQLNGTLTKNMLELFTVHAIKDSYTISEIAKLLKNDNRYISTQALLYLENLEVRDKKTEKLLTKYKRGNL